VTIPKGAMAKTGVAARIRIHPRVIEMKNRHTNMVEP
jgi:hypothetical protein